MPPHPRRWDGLRLSYTEPAGLTPLREAAAALYGGAVAPEQLLVCVPEEGGAAFWHAAAPRACARQGGVVWAHRPSINLHKVRCHRCCPAIKMMDGFLTP